MATVALKEEQAFDPQEEARQEKYQDHPSASLAASGQAFQA
jgi:hypothetical protein